MNKKAQLAITDAVIFLLLVSTSAALSLMSFPSHLGFAEIESISDVKDYAEDTFIVLMRSTLNLEECGINYSKSAVDKYMLLRTSVADDGGDIEPLVFCDMLLYDFARDLIPKRYDFYMTSVYENESSNVTTRVFFADPDIAAPDDYFQIRWRYPMVCFGKSGDAVLSLILWER
ncbi:MAG: hypothetical protein ACE5QW_00985 [Thermoplasmata archaeon]